MEVIIFYGFVVSDYNTKYKRKKSWLFRLTNSVTLVQLKMFHACIKKADSKCLSLI